MAKLITLRDVYKIYGEGLESEVRALDGVSLDIERGEFVAVVGQSGSGKSTMMNVLGCLDIPTRGEYLLDGTDVQELTDKELSRIRNKQIGGNLFFLSPGGMAVGKGGVINTGALYVMAPWMKVVWG